MYKYNIHSSHFHCLSVCVRQSERGEDVYTYLINVWTSADPFTRSNDYDG